MRAVLNGHEVQVQVGDTLLEGTTLIVPEDAEAFLLGNYNHEIEVFGGSTVHLTAFQEDTKRINIDWGTIHNRVPPQPAGHTFTVESPQAVVGVRGTEFSVAVDEEGTKVTVTEGEVWVTEPSGNEIGAFGPGEEVLVATGEQKAPEIETGIQVIIIVIVVMVGSVGILAGIVLLIWLARRRARKAE